jgi:hypothetical protein
MIKIMMRVGMDWDNGAIRVRLERNGSQQEMTNSAMYHPRATWMEAKSKSRWSPAEIE